MNRAILFIAQGLGIGRIPVAPGTFGSVLGVLFFLGIVGSGPLLFGLAVLLSIPLSAKFCGDAEKIMGKKDPGSVVLDEIIALPICFIAWLVILFLHKSPWPHASYFLSKQNWPITVGIFVFFRIFDVWKPWPVRGSQSLPGGWGVTIDDVLAAVYVNVCFVAYYLALHPAI